MRLALVKSGINSIIRNDPSDLEHLVHFHTHPSLDVVHEQQGKHGNTLLINENDYQYYTYLSAWLTAETGHPIPVSGIVLPTCKNCLDAFFITEDVPADPIAQMMYQLKRWHFPE